MCNLFAELRFKVLNWKRRNSGTDIACFSLFLRARKATALPARHVPGLLLAPLTCPDGHSAPVPARNWLASRSSYVPGKTQLSRPGTYLTCFSLFLRARTATAFPPRHVPGLLLALLTCPDRHSSPAPARNWLASRSFYVPGQPQRSSPDT